MPSYRAWMLNHGVLTSCDPGDAQTVWPVLKAVLRGSSPTASYTVRRPQPPTPSWSCHVHQPGINSKIPHNHHDEGLQSSAQCGVSTTTPWSLWAETYPWSNQATHRIQVNQRSVRVVAWHHGAVCSSDRHRNKETILPEVTSAKQVVKR